MILRALILAATLLAATPAAATDWALAVQSSGIGAVYVDVDSVQRMGNGRMRVWLLYVYPKADQRGRAALNTQRDIDCTNRQGMRLRIGSLRDDGSVLDPDEAIDPEWRKVSPGTMDADIFDFLCGSGLTAPELQHFGAEPGAAIRHGQGLMAS